MAIEAAMPQYVDIRLQDGGMHFVARLRGGISDAEVVEHLRRKGTIPLCSLRNPGERGVVPGNKSRLRDRSAGGSRSGSALA